MYRDAQPQYQQPQYQEQAELDPNRPVQYANGGLPRTIAPPPNANLFGNPDNPGNPAKTPNLDTSNGQYQPAFI